MNKTVSVVIGGQIGSEGKGKIAGYLTLKENFKYSIHNFYPNAGHTWENAGEKVVIHHLPISLVNKETVLLIGPGAAIDVPKLMEEIEKYEKKYEIKKRLKIHPRAVVVEERHKQKEKDSDLTKISSTLTGGGAAVAEKIMRSSQIKLCKDIDDLKDYICTYGTENILYNAISNGEKIIVEGAQGFELDINYGYEYPYTTSRQTTIAQVMADSGLPFNSIDRVYCVLRTYPIRVGDTKDGHSGSWGTKELTWEEIEKRAGMPEGLLKNEEFTTTTKKKRRVFEFDFERLKYMVMLNQPTDLCLNHIDYINYSDYGVNQYEVLSAESKKFIEKIEDVCGIPVSLIGTGKNNGDIIDRR